MGDKLYQLRNQFLEGETQLEKPKQCSIIDIEKIRRDFLLEQMKNTEFISLADVMCGKKD